MGMRFFIEDVIINGVKATLDDKFKFDEDYCKGKIKIRSVLDCNGYIDIETV